MRIEDTMSSGANMPMRVLETELSGLLIIEPHCFRDERGLFFESFQSSRYREAGILDEFVQDNYSRSVKGVLRGLHFTVNHPQAQIVTVVRGKIFDVAVDLRKSSQTFGRWFGVELGDEGPRRQIYMAAGFAHGFCALSEIADLHYKVSCLYDHADEGGLLWNDPQIGIRWPIDQPILSPRDASYPPLRDLDASSLPQVDR
jgi:dTDP-4-dehydrorhamnose 3,5-epimerase